MTFVNLLVVLLAGITVLALGEILKKSWVKLLSIIPFAFALWEIIRQSII